MLTPRTKRFFAVLPYALLFTACIQCLEIYLPIFLLRHIFHDNWVETTSALFLSSFTATYLITLPPTRHTWLRTVSVGIVSSFFFFIVGVLLLAIPSLLVDFSFGDLFGCLFMAGIAPLVGWVLHAEIYVAGILVFVLPRALADLWTWRSGRQAGIFIP